MKASLVAIVLVFGLLSSGCGSEPTSAGPAAGPQPKDSGGGDGIKKGVGRLPASK